VIKTPIVSIRKHDTAKNHKVKPIRAKRALKGKRKNLGPEMKRDFLDYRKSRR